MDPLDGTREFVEGVLSAVTVLVGVSHKGKPVAGVIHRPFDGDCGSTVWGGQGLGVEVSLHRRNLR